jgi:hypothetical protein
MRQLYPKIKERLQFLQEGLEKGYITLEDYRKERRFLAISAHYLFTT